MEWDAARYLDGRLKVRHLVLVDALTEHGSVVAAAAHLRLTQPAVTRSLRELEQFLGVTLYDRGPRGVSPTPHGEVFTAHARSVLSQLTQAGRHLAEITDADRGVVTVGVHLAGSNLLLPRAVTRLKAKRPGVTVVIREAAPDALLADLVAGRIDFVVGRLAVAPRGGAGLRQEVLYDEPVRLVARAGHPAHGRLRPHLAELVTYPWILPGPETALRGELEDLFLRHDLTSPTDRIECTSILAVRTLLLESDVIAALPQLIIDGDPLLVALPLALEQISQRVGVTHPEGRLPSPSVLALLEHLREVAHEISASLPLPR